MISLEILLILFVISCNATDSKASAFHTEYDEAIEQWFHEHPFRDRKVFARKDEQLKTNKLGIEQEYTIRSPRKTEYGYWRGWNYCPRGQYAAGIQIKAEGDQRGGDDTGLNAVALFCRPYPSNATDNRNYVISGEGDYGEWQAVRWCPGTTAIIGFALRSEPIQGGNDDVAADNFKACCGSLYGDRTTQSSMQGDTEGWGSWTADQWCPKGRIVCGFNSQIEGPQRGGDDTSLNNIDLDCCKAEIPKCTPNHTMIQLADIDNKQGAGSVTQAYKKTISYTRTTGRTDTMSQEERNAIHTTVTACIGANIEELTSSINVEMGEEHEHVTSEQVSTMVQDSFTHERTDELTVTIPPHTGTYIRQLVITCDEHELKVTKTIMISY